MQASAGSPWAEGKADSVSYIVQKFLTCQFYVIYSLSLGLSNKPLQLEIIGWFSALSYQPRQAKASKILSQTEVRSYNKGNMK